MPPFQGYLRQYRNMGMFGIAYAKRSPKGATRWSGSCNLSLLFTGAWFCGRYQPTVFQALDARLSALDLV
ncbi:MAG: hypothetical protein WCP41_08605 [Verrucomicrobiota bacterium]